MRTLRQEQCLTLRSNQSMSTPPRTPGAASWRTRMRVRLSVLTASIDTSAGWPSELCWLAASPDDRLVFTTNFGYSNISSVRINGAELSIAKDPASPKVAGDGTFRAINGTVSSGPSDSLDNARWRLPLPDLRECLEAGGLRHSPGTRSLRSPPCKFPTTSLRAWRDFV